MHASPSLQQPDEIVVPLWFSFKPVNMSKRTPKTRTNIWREGGLFYTPGSFWHKSVSLPLGIFPQPGGACPWTSCPDEVFPFPKACSLSLGTSSQTASQPAANLKPAASQPAACPPASQCQQPAHQQPANHPLAASQLAPRPTVST